MSPVTARSSGTRRSGLYLTGAYERQTANAGPGGLNSRRVRRRYGRCVCVVVVVSVTTGRG
jgi:hypothetical protein